MLGFVYGALVVLAIGILIFVHELGHFLVAKRVGIRVEAFSLGFGPKIFGFQRGETLYKVSAIPLGGYVKMTGETPGEDIVGDGRDFCAKTISQRAWVVSAGVIMNVIFAFLVFPLAFSMGVPFDAPIAGYVVEGGAAWEADIRTGDKILKIDDTDVIGFSDIRMEVAFSSEEKEFLIERDGRQLTRKVTPVYDEANGFHVIGLLPQLDVPKLSRGRAKDLGIPKDHAVVSINGYPTSALQTVSSVTSLLSDAEKLELEIRYEENGAQTTKSVSLDSNLTAPESGPKWRLGVRFAKVRVATLLDRDAPTVAERMGLREGDVIVRVGDRDVFTEEQMQRAVLDTPSGEPLVVTVRREGDGGPVRLEHALEIGDARGFLSAFRTGFDHVRFGVDPGSPAAEAGLKNGDRFVNVAGEEIPQTSEGHERVLKIVSGSDGKALDIVVDRAGERVELKVIPGRLKVNETLLNDLVWHRTQTEAKIPFPRSIVEGSRQAVHQFTKILMTIRSLISGDVAAKNMGGIITIAVVSYTFAEQGLAKILFFMGILSLNLAILNILPIPVLDGGHLVFLVLEKIKGAPLSDRAMGYANIAGLVFILGLMVFVTFNDIVRFFF